MPLTIAWASLSTRIWPAPESARLIPAKSNWQSLTVWFTGLTVWWGVKKRNTTQSRILNQSETIWIHLKHTLHISSYFSYSSYCLQSKNALGQRRCKVSASPTSQVRMPVGHRKFQRHVRHVFWTPPYRKWPKTCHDEDSVAYVCLSPAWCKRSTENLIKCSRHCLKIQCCNEIRI